MRYVNWDALLFPDGSKIPLQEFKTDCHVLQDHEFLHSQGSPFLLPTVTAFVPSLPVDMPFRISLHCWINPEPSRYTQSFSKHTDLIMFEARVFMDGKHCGTKLFHRDGSWPGIIETGIELDRNGEFQTLKFPPFHSEVLSQSYWNAGDDLGRIKIVIAEGFPRDSMSMPFERVKNVVCFAFQHAPLDVLEASSIAWPNASMWRRVASRTPYLSQITSPTHVKAEQEDHSHSPRRHGSTVPRPVLPPPHVTLSQGSSTFFSGSTSYDPFTEPAHWRQTSNSDTSMPDYSNSNSRQVSEPSVNRSRRLDSLHSNGTLDQMNEALLPSAPDNTPQSVTADLALDASKVGDYRALPGSSREEDNLYGETFAGSDSNCENLICSMPGQIKSRKEGAQGLASPSGRAVGTPVSGNAAPFNASTSGKKRQRIVTPASFKAIDEEDEPRSSPSLRKGSQGRDGRSERRVLSGIDNIH